MDQELQEATTGCTTNSQRTQQLEQIHGAQRDVFLSTATNKLSPDDVSDREIRALCLPDHHLHHHVSDEDSDCVVLDGDTVLVTAGHHLPVGDLILAESTSSSPILAGSGIAHQAAEDVEVDGEEDGESVAFTTNSVHHSAEQIGNSGWRLKRVFMQAEDLITPVDENEEATEEDADVVAAAVVVLEEEDDEAEAILGQQKSGLSRCVATGNLADVVETTSSSTQQQHKGETVDAEQENECTCHDQTDEGGAEGGDVQEKEAGDGERPQQNKCAKCGENYDEDGEQEEEQCSSCGDSERHAISNQFNGVQSEQELQMLLDSAPSADNVNKLRDNATKTTTITASSSTTNSSSSSTTTTITSSSSSSSVIIGRNGDNDDDPLFYSVVNDSGGSSSQSTKSSLLVSTASGSSSKIISSSNCNSAVLTKQQTPTSVRTATSSATTTGPGSFGKSEMQLENPKILSKRLQQLFRAAVPQCVGDDEDDVDAVMHQGATADNGNADVASAANDDDDDDDDDVVVNKGKSQSVKLSSNSISQMDTADCSNAVASSSRVVAEETPSSSVSVRGLEHQVKEEKPDGIEDDGEVREEIVEHEMDTENIRPVVVRRPDNDINEEVDGGDGSASGPEQRQQMQNPPPLQDFDVENAWADCEEVGDESEEICTCQNYSDTEDLYDEDEQLPSKDVDLSGFTTHDLLQESHAAESGSTGGASTTVVGVVATTPLGPGRKRKISEAGSSSGMTSNVDSPCGNGSLYASCLDVIQSKRCRGGKYGSSLGSPKTPTSSVGQIPAFLRTPRCGQSMHLMPRESLPVEMGLWLGQFQKWTEFDRVTALNHIIDLCEPSQVRHVMKVIEPQFQRDFISLLPRELALQVLSYLEPTDLLRAAQTCRNWRFLCDDNLLWKDKCKEGNIIIDVESDRPKRGRAGNMPPIASPWKAAYMRQHIIEMNWRSRPIRAPKVLKGHDDHVITCLQFCGNRIVSGSDDNTLKVWSAVTGKCLRVLVGHTGGVWSSQMSSKYIISGSTDRTLKVWNAETGHCEHTLFGHTSTVRCMHLHGEKVVSGSRDATLRVWDVNRGNCLHVLVGHLAAVRCVQYDGKLVVSGAYDYTVKVWNPERQECLHTLQGHTNRVYSLQFDGIHVVSGSLDTSIRVWDAESGSCKHTLMGHQSLTSGMELRDHILVSGNADSTVKIWDIVSGQCLQTLSGPNKHQSAVTCLQFNSRFVITSSDDGTVKLWDVKTGEFIRNLVALDSGGSGGVVWRIRASDTKLICAVGSRNGTEETKLMVLDFDVLGACLKCS